MLRRLVLTTAATLAALGAGSLASAAPAGAIGPLPLPLFSGPDKLTVTVKDSGNPMADGTFELTCGARTAEGTHPKAQGACDRLEELADEGQDPFTPVPKTRMCTMQYGGPATAHVTGTWQGRPVDAHFDRSNGCEISRWDAMKPVLPMARS
ncbi:subtilase-type protease inhibitor [Streptomyces sp. LP05-1]|uniref:Subtilase-type protease inhibitor n=1 Tax=Streptomyces pyxinae TaxID=2970734 RepID=A0ABT2CCG8_9ACTN|nr:subtilase-type protease inhibitor [Streptomyces sp. LP05-1]MCS0635112.1 subtilase-type protease inhibitor [Streptomyces sp. LP05-1]